jgi:hypothetical protein
VGKLEQISVKIFETFDDLSFQDLMAVAPSAFLEKYKGTLFIRFDEPYVRWMLACSFLT